MRLTIHTSYLLRKRKTRSASLQRTSNVFVFLVDLLGRKL
jgi:hypothetical protein